MQSYIQPEHGVGEDADDEEHGVADEHLGQGDLLWRHPCAGRRLSPPRCSLPQFYRRYDRRRHHHHHHHRGENSIINDNLQVVENLLMVQVELPRHERQEGVLADRVVHTSDTIAERDEKEKSHDNDVNNDDDDGGGGGTQHGLGAERLQDAEASLAGDDGGHDLGNPGKTEESHHVVVCHVEHEWTVPVIKIKKILLQKNVWYIEILPKTSYRDRQIHRQEKDTELFLVPYNRLVPKRGWIQWMDYL